LGNLRGITPMTGSYSGCTQESGFSFSVTGNNQLSTGTSPNFVYDLAGNMTNDTSNSYTYDAEGHTITAAGVTYTYDGDGNRVEKSSGTLYWYDPSGSIIEETNGSGNTVNQYVFFHGGRIARQDSSNNVFYYFADQLGTSRDIVQAGSTSSCYDADFYPYGGERYYTSSCSSTNNYKFTGKERDSESGLDNFGARYDSSSVGRFMTPDWAARPTAVPYAMFGDPQSLDLYSYVRNNPLNHVDMDGHDPAGSGIPTGPTNCAGENAQTTGCGAQKQNTDQTSASRTGAAIGTVAGAIFGGIGGALGGATVGTAVEPGGGTIVVGVEGGTEGAQAGAETGAAAGAAVGALAPVVYTKTKDALDKVGSFINTAIDHLGKLNGPEQDPRGGWKDTVRRSADNIDKQAGRISNGTLRNAAHFTADVLRGLVD